MGKQKKIYWYKLEVPHHSFQTQGEAMNEMLKKFFRLHRVLIQYKPGDHTSMVHCDLSIEELHERHPTCFDLKDVGTIDLDPFLPVYLFNCSSRPFLSSS